MAGIIMYSVAIVIVIDFLAQMVHRVEKCHQKLLKWLMMK